jgi:predicted site-specific integrase-resolvase
MVASRVKDNSAWIVDWEKEGLLPADIIQNNKLEFLESRVLKMENILEK